MNIVTWNMQGATGFGESKWNTDIPRLFRAGAQVLCLQECGNLPDRAANIAVPAWLAGPGAYNTRFVTLNYGTQYRPAIVNVLWVETDPVGHRVNLAVAYSAAAYAAVNSILIANPAGGGTRPAVGLRFPIGGGNNVDVYTIHAQSPGGADGPGLITSIVATAAPFFAAGDYNTNLPWAGGVPLGSVACPNNAAVTHPGSGTNLDYAFRPTAAGAVNGYVGGDFIVSDHLPVGYAI